VSDSLSPCALLALPPSPSLPRRPFPSLITFPSSFFSSSTQSTPQSPFAKPIAASSPTRPSSRTPPPRARARPRPRHRHRSSSPRRTSRLEVRAHSLLRRDQVRLRAQVRVQERARAQLELERPQEEERASGLRLRRAGARARRAGRLKERQARQQREVQRERVLAPRRGRRSARSEGGGPSGGW